MTQLATWTFAEEDGARRVEPALGRLAAEHRLVLLDARVLTWGAGSARPVARRVYSVPLTDAIDDIVWGLFLGQVLYGDEAERPATNSVVERLRAAVQPGRSALIVIGDDPGVQQVVDALAPRPAEVRLEIAADINAALRTLGQPQVD